MTSTPSNNPGCVLCDIKWCTQGDLCGRRSSLAPKSAPIPALNNPTEDDLLRMSQIPLPEGTLGYYPPDYIRKAAARPASNNLKEQVATELQLEAIVDKYKHRLLNANQLADNTVDLILDTILAEAERLEINPSFSGHYINGYGRAKADLRTMLEGMKT